MTGIANLEQCFAGRPVFLTGHTGFKGSWLSLFLARLGAHVTGYALPPATTPSLFELAHVANSLTSNHLADIRDLTRLKQAMQDAKPEIVFHLAAQALVRPSYENPVETWSTNVMGTVNLLEAVRFCPSVKAVVVITTDKCYENREWLWGYRETDALGGNDPYSASKAGAELVVHSYRSSFFSSDSAPLIASARAGNVIGGGDWSQDRLIPDSARAMQAARPLIIRNPHATRPWQHVLESLHGYLRLGARLLAGDKRCATAFNFGPDALDNLPVSALLSRLQEHWPGLNWQQDPASTSAKEAHLLYLDSAKARFELNWQPKWPLALALEKTAEWYRMAGDQPHQARALTDQQLEQFCAT